MCSLSRQISRQIGVAISRFSHAAYAQFGSQRVHGEGCVSPHAHSACPSRSGYAVWSMLLQ